jgi:hypothetical protein
LRRKRNGVSGTLAIHLLLRNLNAFFISAYQAIIDPIWINDMDIMGR